ncbi:LysM peptidoglycan-binding domain-containing protein, partial [Rhodovulum sulfidophilum]|nr:LysM peptidoglycan-binding domain-containing protein [Rhodovulum sulfidophilum]
ISPAGPAGVRVMTVQPGYTLWGIADRTYGRGMQYVKIFEANRGQISDPDLIYPGQIFDLPHVE